MAADRDDGCHHGDRRVAADFAARDRISASRALPPLYWPLLALTLVCYMLLTQGVKTWLIRSHWIRTAF